MALPMIKKLVRVLAVATALLWVSVPAFSQASQSTIQGTVTDQSGGVIAGANVTVTDVARGTARQLVTDGAGAYVAAGVTSGTYTVRIESQGFETLERSGVLVEVGQTIRVDAVLQPGVQTQTVTVSGELPVIDTSDAQLGGTVSNTLVNALPLNGRNFQRLLELHPGVVTQVGAGTGTGTYTNGRKQGDDLFRIEGITTVAQTAGLSGVINAAYRAGDSGSLLPIDAIQEFNTQQMPKAQDGWKEGSTVSIAMKSGTNGIHGSAYAFGRDATATDAKNAFSSQLPAAQQQVTPGTLEQFGATVGGPIIKDKLFWFASYEGLRDSLGASTTDNVPSDCATLACTTATGASSINLIAACNSVGRANVNPLSAQIAGLPAGSCVPDFTGTLAPENLFPQNLSPTTSFLPPLVSTEPLNNGIAKVDYNPNAKNHFSGMMFITKAYQVVNTVVGQVQPYWENGVIDNTHMYTGSWTWTPNSTWVNDFRGGLAYLANATTVLDANKLAGNPYPTGYGIPTGVTNPTYGGMPTIAFSGFSNFQLGAGINGATQRGPEGNLDFVDNVSYLRGKHAFRFGFEYVDILYDQGQGGNIRTPGQGGVTFASLTSFLGLGTNGKGNIIGGSNTGILEGDNTNQIRSHWFAGFAQDDWRLTTRVTLNLGLRYEFYGPLTERNNYLGVFNPNVNAATTPAVQQIGPGRPYYNASYDNVSPRFGVAWDVRGDGKTVVRAGANLLSDYAPANTQLVKFSPFGANFCLTATCNASTAIISNAAANAHTALTITSSTVMGWNTATNLALVPALNGQSTIFPTATVAGLTGLTCSFASPCQVQTVVNPNFHNPRAAEWNLDIQRAITSGMSVDVAYVGNHGFDEGYQVDLNQPAVGSGFTNIAGCIAVGTSDVPNTSTTGPCGTAGAASVTALQATEKYHSLFPYLNYITQEQSNAISNYNGLQVTLNQRASYGLSFIAGYTFARASDDTPGGLPTFNQANGLPTASQIRSQFYGYGAGDIRNRFTFSPTWDVPGRKAPGQMLQGWSLTALVLAQSGLPWTAAMTTTGDLLGTGENSGPTGNEQVWNIAGPAKSFNSDQTLLTCYAVTGSALASTCSPMTVGSTVWNQCLSAAQAPYAGNTNNMGLAQSALLNYGCYVKYGSILTPPAYGTNGDAGYGIFRGPSYWNVDFSVAKTWKFKERYSAQFRAEFFNVFNHADYQSLPLTTDPSKGSGTGQFGCSCNTPDAGTAQGNPNPILGSGGPRHIQFGLKLLF